MNAHKALAAVRGFVFDIDGTIALTDASNKGHRALPGAAELLERLRTHGLPFLTFTNGSGHPPAETAASLRHAGLDVRDEEVLTPSVVAAELFVRKGYRRVLVLGTVGVSHSLVAAGIEVVHAPARADDADAVYIGWYPRFSLPDLEAACHAAWGGAALYAASIAPYFATSHGRTLGISGAIAAAITSVTKKRVTVIGKPAAHGLRTASRRLGIEPAKLAVVGDDPTLEMAMARAGGALAIAVQTGIADAAALSRLPPKQRPHFALRDVGELAAIYPWPV
jgi:NagD protein